jgi:hypothetical protein
MKSTSPKSRAKYGFKLVFPSEPFTIRDLRKQRCHKISYISIYKRVEKGLKDGVIKVVSEVSAKGGSKGRPQKVFATV